jgi:hypothetical protein
MDEFNERRITELMVESVIETFENYKRILVDDMDMVNDETYDLIVSVYNTVKKHEKN